MRRPKRQRWSTGPTGTLKEVWWSCGRKVRYASRLLAEIGGGPRGQVPYICSFCQGWHVTQKQAAS